MAKFRIISKKELQEVTERYFGECRFVYSYEYCWIHIYIKYPVVTAETFKKWLKECFGEYLTLNLPWHPLDNEKKEDQAKRLGFSEWEPGEYYKLGRKIEEKDANFMIDQWSDWATELHKRSVIFLSSEIVEKAIKEYRIRRRDERIDRLWD